MPTDTAMETLHAFRLKRKQNPNADRTTLFKYVLWDRFSGKLVTDTEMEAMAASSSTLAELAFAILAREKPALAEGRLAASAKDAVRRFFEMNYPDGL